jgi:hypothetical protein
MMDLREQVEKLQTRDDFIKFMHELVQDLRTHPEHWDNSSLDGYLEAFAAWVHDMDGYYRNRGEESPQQLTWKRVGEMLLAARTYE